ncbi:MAG: decarboxylase [Peptococcaceae bacterium]|nr:decarboxylase [Peptococcaceae bacterium]
MLEQDRTPILEALIEYAGLKALRMHVPGHGGGSGAPEDLLESIGIGALDLDVTELPGLDDLNNPSGIIADAQRLAAKAFGAEKSYFLVNGTTQGLQALIMAVSVPGGKLILPRNVHRSVVGGMILAGLNPVFVRPATIPAFNIPAGVPVPEYKKAMKDNPDASGVLCIHPTYHGVTGDLKIIAEAAHFNGKPVLVDEAHGSHFYFHQELPLGALECNADAAVQSIHKTGGSLTQSSMLHIQGNILKSDKIAAALRLIQTSSPSYLLMASLDSARRRLAVNGEDIFNELMKTVTRIRNKLADIKHVEVLNETHMDGQGAVDFDFCRLVIRVSGMGITGYQAADWLMKTQGIFVEMADYDNIVAVPFLGMGEDEGLRLVNAIRDLAVREGREGASLDFSMKPSPIARQVVGLRDAWFASSRRVLLSEAIGSICGEWLAIYPPGTPVIMPGEEISHEMVNYLIWAKQSGACFQGAADSRLKYIRVID